MGDIQGAPVEKYKIHPESLKKLAGIRKVQRKMKEFELIKEVFSQKMQMAEEALVTEGQRLLSTLPKDSTMDLEGMNFPEVDNQNYKLRY